MEGCLEFVKLRSNLNELIQAKGLKKTHVANQVGVTPTQLSNWITTPSKKYVKSIPSVLNALILAQLLGCKVEDIFELVDEE